MSTRLPESDNKFDLFAPIQVLGAKMRFERRQKLGEQRRVADGLVEALADGGLEIDA